MISKVRSIVSSNPATDGLIQANLKIAEDRILSYLLVLVDDAGGRSLQTHWVPTSTFYFESEGTVKELVLQRRRWLNGTSAGYVWLLQQPALWDGVRSLRSMSLRVLVLSLLQLLVTFGIAIYPALIMVAGFLSLGGVGMCLASMGVQSPSQDDVLRGFKGLFFVASGAAFVALVYTGRAGRTSYTAWAWNTRFILNAMTMIALVAVAFFINAVAVFAPNRLQAAMIPGADPGAAIASQTWLDPVLVARASLAVYDVQSSFCFIVVMGTSPFFLGLLHSDAR
jgi:cellulose synthase/poly-beta-1,6-N-acetylglucosamine synthase-like glycosyltransferase